VSDLLELPHDGRKARSERSREAVLDAMIDLIMEGQSPPSTEAIAERAGISPASLFRHFATLEELREVTIARFFDRYSSLYRMSRLGVGPRKERVERYVDTRLALYVATAPMARFARARSLDRPELAAALLQLRERHVDATQRHFANELREFGRAARHDVGIAITSLTSFESWDTYSELQRSTQQIRRSWIAALTTLLERPT
jgi:TetR/AcrR family transcriptional regulator, regulator of autoinduction and epiphytic fitness